MVETLTLVRATRRQAQFVHCRNDLNMLGNVDTKKMDLRALDGFRTPGAFMFQRENKNNILEPLVQTITLVTSQWYLAALAPLAPLPS